MTEIPFVKAFDFEYGAPSRLSPLITRVIANNPGPFTYTGTGVYLIGAVGAAGRSVCLIDPGPEDPVHFDALMTAVGAARISHIFITHTHIDHCGGARAFAARCGAPVYGFGPHPQTPEGGRETAMEEGGDLRFAPDVIIKDGERIEGDGWTLDAVHTPGHLSNHLCFALREEKALFSGDHIMGWSTSVIVPPTGDMGAYLDSLDRLLARDDAIYYPTHGAPIENPHRFVRAVRAHRHVRDGQILNLLRNGRTQITGLVAAMYADVDPRLHPAASMNVFAHLIRLHRIGSVTCDGAPMLGSEFRLAETNA